MPEGHTPDSNLLMAAWYAYQTDQPEQTLMRMMQEAGSPITPAQAKEAVFHAFQMFSQGEGEGGALEGRWPQYAVGDMIERQQDAHPETQPVFDAITQQNIPRIQGATARSGDPTLDALIEQYLQRGDYHLYADMGIHPNERAPLNDLRSPEGAMGRCEVLAADFADFVTEHGLEADVDSTENVTSFPGYAEAKGELNDHAVTYVLAPTGRYNVDWTASQFGFSDFPKVVRVAGTQPAPDKRSSVDPELEANALAPAPSTDRGWIELNQPQVEVAQPDPNCKWCYGQGYFFDGDHSIECGKCMHGRVSPSADFREAEPIPGPSKRERRDMSRIPSEDLRSVTPLDKRGSVDHIPWSGNGPVTIWGHHLTTPEDADSIRANGFDLARHTRGTWGAGVHAFVNGRAGDNPGGKKGAKLPVQFTLNNPLVTELNYRSQINYDHPGQQEIDRLTRGLTSPQEKAEALKAAGYDGVVVMKDDVGQSRPHVAVAFNPENVQVDAPHFPYGIRAGDVTPPDNGVSVTSATTDLHSAIQGFSHPIADRYRQDPEMEGYCEVVNPAFTEHARSLGLDAQTHDVDHQGDPHAHTVTVVNSGGQPTVVDFAARQSDRSLPVPYVYPLRDGAALYEGQWGQTTPRTGKRTVSNDIWDQRPSDVPPPTSTIAINDAETEFHPEPSIWQFPLDQIHRLYSAEHDSPYDPAVTFSDPRAVDSYTAQPPSPGHEHVDLQWDPENQEFIVGDGHHRIAAAVRRGDTHIPARVHWPRVVDDIPDWPTMGMYDGAEDWSKRVSAVPSSRVAGETLPQQQRRWHTIWDEHGLNEPDAQPLREHLDDGWSVDTHESPASVHAVGRMMNNCWQSTKPEHMEEQAYQGWKYHSLHDDLGIPRAAWYTHDDPWTKDGPRIRQALGTRNAPVDPAHAPRIQAWADQQGVDTDGAFADAPSHLQAQATRTGGMTRTQLLAQAQAHEAQHGPDTSEVVHEFPDGWTMRQLQTYADAHREGTLMGNCYARPEPGDTDWNGLWSEHPQGTWTGPEGDENDFDSSNITDLSEPLSGSHYSLRDPDNLPRVSINTGAEMYDRMLGRHNGTPKQDYLARIRDWADHEGHADLSHEANQWLAEHYGDGAVTSSDKRIAMPQDPAFLNALSAEHEETPPHGKLRAIHPEYGEVGGIRYGIRTHDGEGPRLPRDFPYPQAVSVGSLDVRDEHQRKGVATWLMQQLEQRHPGVPIYHGHRTGEGNAWAYNMYGQDGHDQWTLDGQPWSPTGSVTSSDNRPYGSVRTGEHDYDPNWDYDVLFDQYDHPLVQQAQQIATRLSPGSEVHPVDLSHQGVVAKYVDGTYSRPVIVFDPFWHENAHPQEVENTIRHELRHAEQESRGEDYDEDDAEHGWRGDVTPPDNEHYASYDQYWSDEPSSMLRQAEYMAPEHCLPYREYDWSADNNRDGSEHWNALRDHVAQHGFNEPAFLHYNPTSGKGYFGEGNHRVGIAHELGIPVPVVVYRMHSDDERYKPITEPGKYRYEDARGFSQFGQYEKPSRIGLPVVPGPEQRTANILDAPHSGLDPAVWLDPESPEPILKPELRHWLETTIKAALAKHGYDGMDEWLSLVLTGSLTTYQYSVHSDCDISLWVDAPKFPEWSRAEMIAAMVSEFDDVMLPGTTHPVQAFVVASTKLTKDDLYAPGLRSGYDLQTQRWIEPPDRSRVHDVEHEMNGDYTYALEVADKMESLLRHEPDKAISYWNMIHKRRQRDQGAGKGDFSQANIVYKMLANRGLEDGLRALGVHIA